MILKKIPLLVFLLSPFFLLAQKDSEEDEETLFEILVLEGTLKDDGDGLFVESKECALNGKYLLRSFADETVADSKAAKMAKKDNSKAEKQIKTFKKKVKKEKSKAIERIEVTGYLKEGEKVFQPLNISRPMDQPVAIPYAPLTYAYLALVYGLYEKTLELKAKARVVTVIEEKGEYKFLDVNCNEISPEDLEKKSEELVKVNKNANTVAAANIASIAVLSVALVKAQKEIAKLSAAQKVMMAANIASAVARQGRMIRDNKRIKNKLEETRLRLESVLNF